MGFLLVQTTWPFGVVPVQLNVQGLLDTLINLIVTLAQSSVLAAEPTGINTEGVVTFFASNIAPILLAVLGVIFIGRASRKALRRPPRKLTSRPRKVQRWRCMLHDYERAPFRTAFRH